MYQGGKDMNWSFINYFYCISLRPNVQRWNDSVQQFIQAGIPWVEREIKDEPGDDGNRFLAFNHSHYETIRKGYDTGHVFAIFEDDIMFTPQVGVLEEAFRQLPEDWDMLYMGANIIGSDVSDWKLPTRYSSHLATLHNAWQTHAIAYSQKGAKFVLDNFDPNEFPVLDEWIRVTMMPGGKVFVCNPMVAYQRPCFSDLWKVQANYGCHEPGNKYLRNI